MSDDATRCAWCAAPDADERDEDGDPCCLACLLLAERDEATGRTERAVVLLGLRWRRETAEC